MKQSDKLPHRYVDRKMRGEVLVCSCPTKLAEKDHYAGNMLEGSLREYQFKTCECLVYDYDPSLEKRYNYPGGYRDVGRVMREQNLPEGIPLGEILGDIGFNIVVIDLGEKKDANYKRR